MCIRKIEGYYKNRRLLLQFIKKKIKELLRYCYLINYLW